MQLIIKRLFDISVSVFALTVGFPLILVIALYVKLHSKDGIIFKHQRAGMYGKPFSCLKFKTMTDERGADGLLLPDNLRLKRWGRILRATSLDELPQFINVLRGEMSLIGPRALPIKYLPLYSSQQMRRHEMRPGITSWTAVNGRNCIEWSKKFEMDIWYIDNWSLLLDMKILFKTFSAILGRKGVNRPGYATRDDFVGNL